MKPLPMLLPRKEQNAADRLDRASVAADQAAHVVGSDADLDTHVLAVAVFVNLDKVRRAD